MDWEVGKTYKSKTGERYITIDREAEEFCGERQFAVRNAATGRETTISLSGLNRKFVPFAVTVSLPGIQQHT